MRLLHHIDSDHTFFTNELSGILVRLSSVYRAKQASMRIFYDLVTKNPFKDLVFKACEFVIRIEDDLVVDGQSATIRIDICLYKLTKRVVFLVIVN